MDRTPKAGAPLTAPRPNPAENETPFVDLPTTPTVGERFRSFRKSLASTFARPVTQLQTLLAIEQGPSSPSASNGVISLKHKKKSIMPTFKNKSGVLQYRYSKTNVNVDPMPNSSSFYFLGDSGTYNAPLRTVVRNMKTDVDGSYLPKAVSFLGDNFYPKGTMSVDDEHFMKTFQTIYPESNFPIDFYAILGNHDYYGNIQSQIAYTTRDPTSRWKMPSKWFKAEHVLKLAKHAPDRDKTGEFDEVKVLVLYLDTFSLDLHETLGMLGYANFAGYKSRAEVDATMATLRQEQPKQMKWLEDSLRKAEDEDFDYRIVCGHYPVYSLGVHGTSPTLIEILVPVMQRYKVDFYINGHDHTLQLSQVDEVVYCTAGSVCNEFYMQHDYSKPKAFFSRVPGYARIEVTKEKARLSIVDINNKVVATEIVQNKHLPDQKVKNALKNVPLVNANPSNAIALFVEPEPEVNEVVPENIINGQERLVAADVSDSSLPIIMNVKPMQSPEVKKDSLSIAYPDLEIDSKNSDIGVVNDVTKTIYQENERERGESSGADPDGEIRLLRQLSSDDDVDSAIDPQEKGNEEDDTRSERTVSTAPIKSMSSVPVLF